MYSELVQLSEKLRVLADAAKYDASCASSGSRRAGTKTGLGSTQGMGICHSYTPDGRCVSLLKVLFTNACIYDCRYCVNRVSSSVPRAAFSVAELVRLTMDFYRRNYIEGLFLSSGIVRSPDDTMAELTEVARRLRVEEGFGGYIHLKAVPGASAEAVAAAGVHADRLSANVELPSDADLQRLAPAKTMAAVDSTMGEIHRRCRASNDRSLRGTAAPAFAPAGQSTQMIVGATPSPDRSLLHRSSALYAEHALRRVYYSAFSPIPSASPLLPSKPAPLVREHRLYQADWLMRFYGFTAEELTTDESPNLSLEMDPKLAWALRHRHVFPLDLNRADREMLLRIPGIGARSVTRLLAIRRQRAIRLEDLRRLRLAVKRALPFIVCVGHGPGAGELESAKLAARLRPKARQLELFEAGASARDGQL